MLNFLYQFKTVCIVSPQEKNMRSFPQVFMIIAVVTASSHPTLQAPQRAGTIFS